MAKHILDGYDLSDMSFPTKGQESELWKESVPSFCPKCEEIRGDVEGGTFMANSLQTFNFKSFGMCSSCYVFKRDNPIEAAKNSEVFKKKQEEKQLKQKESLASHRFRVFLFEPNERLPSSDYAMSITKIKFSKYPSTTSRGAAISTIPFLTKEKADEIVEILQSKQLTCWIEEIKHGF